MVGKLCDKYKIDGEINFQKLANDSNIRIIETKLISQAMMDYEKRTIIVSNDSLTVDCKNFTRAHELGHILLRDNLQDTNQMGIDLFKKKQRRTILQANY